MVWISSFTGLKLAQPPSVLEPVHGAHQMGRPTMVELGGRQLLVVGVDDRWVIAADGRGVCAEAWALRLVDGRRLILVRDLLRSGWSVASNRPSAER